MAISRLIPGKVLRDANFESGLIDFNSRPLLVLAYGVYGTSLEPEFRPEILPLLKRGYMIALAHVRGGGELGPSWTVQGRCRNKENSVTDLHDVIQHLVKVEKYVDGNQVAVMGESAGGLLVGSLLNRYPGVSDHVATLLMHCIYTNVF